MVKVAFIGGGINSAVGQTHKIACQMDGRFQVVAGAFSRNQEINKQTGEVFQIPLNKVYDHYEELLIQEQGEVDAIIVLVPTDRHSEVVRKCILAGYPVICEKSLATSTEQGKELLQLVEEKEGFLCVTYNYTGYPMIRLLKEKIQQEELGNINHIEIEMPQEGFSRYTLTGEKPIPQKWRLLDYEIPTISLDLGTHLHNMITFLTNKQPVGVVARENTYGFFEGIIDDVNCMIDYSDKMTVQMWYSKVALGHRNGLRVRVYGNKGSAEWYQLEPEILKISNCLGETRILDRSNDWEIGNAPRYTRFKVGHPAGFIEAFANYYQDIYEALKQYKVQGQWQSDYILPLECSVEGLQLFEQAHQSALERTWREIVVS